MSDQPLPVHPEPSHSPAEETAPPTHHEPAQASFAQFMATGWAAPDAWTPPTSPVAPFAAARRQRLSEAFPGDVLIVPSGDLKVRANDTDYAFRPLSDFYWLTGCTDAAAVLVMTPRSGGHDATLFVAGRSDRSTPAFYTDGRRGELWVGPRVGVQETAAMLDIQCAPANTFPDIAGKLSAPVRAVRQVDPTIDAVIPASIPDADGRLSEVLSELRLVKDSYELERLQEAIDSTHRGFDDCLSELATATQQGRGERWLEGTFWRRSRLEGNDVGYGSICAAGHHATTLHWMRNDGAVRPGDLLLMDMGVESDSLYTADVTRTFPISGEFTAAQRQVYEVVLAAQKAGIEATKPGAAFLDPHRAAMRVCAEALHDWGLLPVSVEQSLDESGGPGAGMHRRYTLHGTSHMLGLDVHDCAAARKETYRGATLVENMVLTVEPGIYFQRDDITVPEELRGVGIRIEDDVAVTATGVRNMSDAMPREVGDVQDWMRNR